MPGRNRSSTCSRGLVSAEASSAREAPRIKLPLEIAGARHSSTVTLGQQRWERNDAVVERALEE